MAEETISEVLMFCKSLDNDLSAMVEKVKDDSEKEILTAYQEKLKIICSDIDSWNKDNKGNGELSKCFQTITELVLNFTYVDECRLVDEEFPEESAYKRVTYILETLHQVELLAEKVASVLPEKSTQELLGADVVECLHWRKGALLYMYCHTLNSKCSVQDLPANFTQCLQDGVKFLTSMLSTRCSPKWLSQSTSGNVDNKAVDDDGDETNQLLAQGILSDTHLLALMYCGEMCYWHAQAREAQRTRSSIEKSTIEEEKPANIQPVSNIVSDGSIEDATQSSSENANCDMAEASVKLKTTESHTGAAASNIEDSADYSSEACAKHKPGCVSSCANKLNMVRIGQLSLENYVRAAQGPMLAGGWSTTRAEEVLQYFSRLKV